MSSAPIRSLLFAPGSRPDRFEKALASGAHGVILDLEDAVAPQDKAAARGHVRRWPRRTEAIVRVNGADTPFFDEDLAMAHESGVKTVMLPKADIASLARLSEACGEVRAIALIETVEGYAQLAEISRNPRVSRLAFGNLDFSLDAGIIETGRELDPVRLQIVLTSRLAGLPAPIDGVTTGWLDPAAVSAAAKQARALGFGGKLCIHPSQVAGVNLAFAPSDQERDWARRVIEASSAGAAVALDGKMIDAPVVRRAQAILADDRA